MFEDQAVRLGIFKFQIFKTMKKVHFLQQENYAQEANNLDPIYYNTDQLMTTDMLIKALHTCRRSIQNYRDSGKLTFYKVGGKILYRMSDVYKMLDKHKIQSF